MGQTRFETWLRDDYHLRRHGGIAMKPLDRFLAGAESTLIQRLAPPELDHAFMGRLVRLVRNDATVKLGGQFYEVNRAGFPGGSIPAKERVRGAGF